MKKFEKALKVIIDNPKLSIGALSVVVSGAILIKIHLEKSKLKWKMEGFKDGIKESERKIEELYKEIEELKKEEQEKRLQFEKKIQKYQDIKCEMQSLLEQARIEMEKYNQAEKDLLSKK